MEKQFDRLLLSCSSLSVSEKKLALDVWRHFRPIDSWCDLKTYVESIPFENHKRVTFYKHLISHWVFKSQISMTDSIYPILLKEIYQAPETLNYRGDLALLQKPMIAVVGTRRMTDYGQQALHKLMPTIIEAGFVVVSGLASGVDSLAMKLAVELGGQVVGVIGTGLNHVYPKENHHFQKFLYQKHLVISEYEDNQEPRPYHFPQRNRIIAGLAQATLVIEAQEKSGSLITANLALDENRQVFCLPGPITSPTSLGCHQLIDQGAVPIYSQDKLAEELKDLKIAHPLAL